MIIVFYPVHQCIKWAAGHWSLSIITSKCSELYKTWYTDLQNEYLLLNFSILH